MKNRKKKAFTLTELLVVVVVLGVLSTVAVPKFMRVLETRKTTEAEQVFSAIRTEQETRCISGKEYAVDVAQVPVMASAVNSANYQYSLDGAGTSAISKSGNDYTLRMLSYKDGRICCEGTYCSSLNKTYPSCEGFTVDADECANASAEPTEPEPEPVQDCTDAAYAAAHACECSPSTKNCCAEDERLVDGVCLPNESECEDNDPDDCPGGYWNSDCICVTCDAGDNLRVNAAGNGCECTIDINTCKASGMVFGSRINEAYTWQFCDCFMCSIYGGKRGVSSDGTVAGCEDDTACTLTREDCAKEGKLLAGVGSKCHCVTCEDVGKSGTSTDGTSNTCETKACSLSYEECGAQGKVFYTALDGSCACRPCSDFTTGSGSEKAKTTTGRLKDCSACGENVCYPVEF